MGTKTAAPPENRKTMHTPQLPRAVSNPLSPHSTPPPLSVAKRAVEPLVLDPAVSDQVRLIAGLTAQKDYSERSVAIGRLGKNLPRADLEGLYAFLRSDPELYPDLDALSLGALKNDVLDALIAQESLPPDLLTTLLSIYRNPATDLLLRDYCLQHVAPYYERRWPIEDAGREKDPARAEALQVYDEALGVKHTLAGTALLGMVRLSERYPEIDKTKLADRCLASALDDNEDVSTRITATGLCAALGQTNVLPVARVLAQTGEPIPLRLAAVNAIASVGTVEDLELLESLAAGSDGSVKNAALSALAKLKRAASSRTPESRIVRER
jgi:hypothetical protein